MLHRRAFLAGAASSLAAVAALASEPIPAPEPLAFRVVRKRSVIGEHALSFTRTTDGLIVSVAVDLVVRLGPLPVYRYRHRVTETWRGEAVVRLESETSANGKLYRVLAERDAAAALVVEGTVAGRYAAPADALPATHWNRRMLDGPMINTQTGALMSPVVTAIGAERIVDGRGVLLDAERYALTGDATLDTWYDQDDRWAAIAFAAEDGSVIEYERL